MKTFLSVILASLCFGEAQSQWTTSGTNIYNSNTGNVGVGTSTPGTQLDVSNIQNGQTQIRIVNTSTGSSAGAGLQLLTNSGGSFLWHPSSSFVVPALANNTILTDGTGGDIILFGASEIARFKNSGNVGIGTINPGSNKLAVEGTIAARKVVVTIANSFPDYVFKKDYRLPSLSNVASYIRANGHLPEMPTAASVEKNGLDLGGNQVVLVKKIEELTLYIIEQNKKNEEQSRELKTQRERIDRLERLIEQSAKK